MQQWLLCTTILIAEGVLGYTLTEIPTMHSQDDIEDANCTILKNQVKKHFTDQLQFACFIIVLVDSRDGADAQYM